MQFKKVRALREPHLGDSLDDSALAARIRAVQRSGWGRALPEIKTENLSFRDTKGPQAK